MLKQLFSPFQRAYEEIGLSHSEKDVGTPSAFIRQSPPRPRGTELCLENQTLALHFDYNVNRTLLSNINKVVTVHIKELL
jgi:hypothetical protein